jgi:hypothetical protein
MPKEGGASPEPVLKHDLELLHPHEPTPEEVAKESNGKALADIIDPATGR